MGRGRRVGRVPGGGACALCGRALRASGRVYGPGCARGLRAARARADLALFHDGLVDKAAQLVAEGGITGDGDGGFLAVSTCGTTVYVVRPAEGSCSCPAGVHGVRCYHLAAAAIMAAV